MGLLLGLFRGAPSDLALQKLLLHPGIIASGGGKVRLYEPLPLVEVDGLTLIPCCFFLSLSGRLPGRSSLFL